LEKDIRNWLSAPDPYKSYNIAYESPHHGSAAWLLQNTKYSESKESEAAGSLLWVHGKRDVR